MTKLILTAMVIAIALQSCSTGKTISKSDYRDVSRYYYGPFRASNAVFYCFKKALELNTTDNEAKVAILTGGLLLAHSKAGNDEIIGVITFNEEGTYTGLRVKKSLFNRCLAGQITTDELAASMEVTTLSNKEIKLLQTSNY
ncbi:MAG: hypothetical protein U1C46_12125 [Bacteroidales bacterium]|nr:hypothetical protein [Bacteroidales bacterium]